MTRLKLEIVTNPGGLASRAEAWDRLVAESEARAPTVTSHWTLAWWHTFGDLGRELRVGLFWGANDRLVGIAPLSSRLVTHTGLGFVRLELLASGEPEADEICSDYIGLIARRGVEQDVAAAFAQALARGGFGPCHELLLPALDGEQPMTDALEASLGDEGFRVLRETTTQSPYVPLPKTYDAYLAALSASQRYRIRRARRDFEQWAGEKAACVVPSTREGVERGFEVLKNLHRERWSTAGRSGVFSSPRFLGFHRSVVPTLWERGQVELLWLEAHGRPVAALYNLVLDGAVQFYQSGRAMGLPKGIRPGLVLHAMAIERAIAAGRHEYDFLPGPSRYKMGFALATRPIVSLRAVRPGVKATLRRTADRAVEAVKALRDGLRA